MRLTPRTVRRGLLALLLVVSGAVAFSLRRPGVSGPATAPSRPDPGSKGTTLDQMVLMRFGEGDGAVRVSARHVGGTEGNAQLLEGVEATVPYVESGTRGTLTIRADRCRYTPEPQKAKFRGHVQVRSTTGLELDTEELDYKSASQEGSSKVLVRFKHGNLSGSAVGATFSSAAGVQLFSEVKLLLASATGPPTTIESGQAQVSRAESRIYFDGGVHVVQGNRELRCNRLQLNMVNEFKTVQHAAAIEDVDLRMGAGGGPGAVSASEGEKRLLCRKLMVGFSDEGVPQEATAHNPAVLELSPATAGGERRRIAANQLRFVFDAQGRLTSLEGHAGGPADPVEQQTTVLTATAPGVQRRVECKEMQVALDPATGAVTAAQLAKEIAFSEPGRKAWAQRADYREAAGVLVLEGDPRLVDQEQGSDLRAQRIELGTRSHGIKADEGVRHTLTRRSGKVGPAPLGAGDEPTVLLCRHFEYDAATKTARYRENALMRSGRDEIRAPLLVIEQPAEGRRRLTASGGVASLLHPRPEKGQTREPAVVEARSREMVYDEKENRVVYTGDVEMRQGDVITRSPETVVLLTPDGHAVDRMLAGAPVEVHQGARSAKGERATYTPKDETVVLVGEKVVLQEVDRRLEGRVVTFQSGSDRIRVDGRDEVRTEAVLKRKEPRKP